MFKWLAVVTAAAVAAPLALLFFMAAVPVAGSADSVLAGGPSALALADIPLVYPVLYMDAARTCPGLPWAVLAGIGKAESDHGRSQAPGVRSGANYAGAEGPMQFEPGTFAAYAVDGDHDGRLNVYDSLTGEPVMLLSDAFALHDLAAHHAGVLAGVVPNPAPVAPPGLSGRVSTLLAWWKWGALIAGVFGLIGCGAMMAIGRRNRSNLPADGATGIPWVLAGLTLIAPSSGIVAVFM